MGKSIQIALPPMEVTTVDQRTANRSISVDHHLREALTLLNQAVGDCGYTLDALEASMGKGRAYIHKVLQGEKPLSYAFVVSLPHDVEARFESLRAKALGHIVVVP